MDRRKACGYIRVVTEDRNAVDEQKRNIEIAAMDKGYELVEIYTDTGSGASLEREGIRKLLNDVRKNGIEVVITGSSEILSTDENNTMELMEALTTLNVSVYSVDGKNFLNAPGDTLGNLSRQIYNTLSEMERNGVDLMNDGTRSERPSGEDLNERFQGAIINAYLRMHTDSRSRV